MKDNKLQIQSHCTQRCSIMDCPPLFFSGNTVEFKGPCGGFEYRPNSFKHLSLVVSGIGCTPAIQLVREVANDPRDQTSICLIYYADKASELTYGAELEKYGSNDPRIKLFFTVGEVDQDNDQWEGGVGYIDSEMLSAHLPVPAEDSHQIILCGGPSMVTNALRSLADLGYPSERVFVYGQLGAQQVRGIYGRFASLSAHTRGSGQDKGWAEGHENATTDGVTAVPSERILRKDFFVWSYEPCHSQELSISNFPCSLTWNITSQSMKNCMGFS